jgi:hypothetical protein
VALVLAGRAAFHPDRPIAVAIDQEIAKSLQSLGGCACNSSAFDVTPRAQRLVRTRGLLHAGRSALGAVATLIFLTASKTQGRYGRRPATQIAKMYWAGEDGGSNGSRVKILCAAPRPT